jgi:hypothetical protein
MNPPNPCDPHDGSRIERRTLLKGLAAGVAGTLASADPAAALEPAIEQAAQPTPPTPVSALPRILDDHQRRTLTSLAEILVPGSVAAGTVDLIDRVSAIETPIAQRRLLNAIARFDQEAQSAHAQPWIALGEASRLAILRRAADAVTPGTPEGLAAQFAYLRERVATTYFQTEAGLKDRGWAGRSAWTDLPGCPHPPSAHE